MFPTGEKLAGDQRSEQGAWLFLASLTVFFLACMIAYAIYVLMRVTPQPDQIQSFFLPRSFVLTTVILVAISVLLHLAVGAIRREKRIDFARYVILAFILSVTFFAVQGAGLAWMITEVSKPNTPMRNLYGLTFFLVLIHALHVVGGVAGIVFLLFGLSRGAYDHERYFPVRFCAMYWHFLDLVWISMLASFALTAYVSNLPA